MCTVREWTTNYYVRHHGESKSKHPSYQQRANGGERGKEEEGRREGGGGEREREREGRGRGRGEGEGEGEGGMVREREREEGGEREREGRGKGREGEGRGRGRRERVGGGGGEGGGGRGGEGEQGLCEHRSIISLHSGSIDSAHVQQNHRELCSFGLHGLEDLLSTETLVWVLLHVSIHRHHKVLAIELESMPSKEEQGVYILAYKRLKILHSLYITAIIIRRTNNNNNNDTNNNNNNNNNNTNNTNNNSTCK